MKEIIVYDINGKITMNFAVNVNYKDIDYEVPVERLVSPEVKRIVLRDIGGVDEQLGGRF